MKYSVTYSSPSPKIWDDRGASANSPFIRANTASPGLADTPRPGRSCRAVSLISDPEKAVGIINGREANRELNGETLYGVFSVGLFIYDYENGKIEWVSPEPLIRDSEARTITFASQFIETKSNEGILYAHVDDSFVRAYTLYAEGIRGLLP